MSRDLNNVHLADLWAEILNFTDRREVLFGPYLDLLVDRGRLDADRLPHPGFVGQKYSKGGLLFLAMNPAKGLNNADPGEEPHYACLRRLRDARSDERLRAFDELMVHDESWHSQIRIMNVVVKPVLDGLGLSFDHMAYLNVLKWRTKENDVPAPLYQISLKAHTLNQLEALEPGLIVILGKKLSHELEKIPEFWQPYGDRTVTLPRTNGDRYLKPEGHLAVRQACLRFRALHGAQAQAPGKPILVPKVIKETTPRLASVAKGPTDVRQVVPYRGGKAQADKNRDQAWEFREQWHAKSVAMGIPLEDFILEVGRDNDVAIGMKGPRHAIVALAQKMATQGRTYGEVKGMTVPKAGGKTHKIGEGDLLGYVVANGYCKLVAPVR